MAIPLAMVAQMDGPDQPQRNQIQQRGNRPDPKAQRDTDANVPAARKRRQDQQEQLRSRGSSLLTDDVGSSSNGGSRSKSMFDRR